MGAVVVGVRHQDFGRHCSIGHGAQYLRAVNAQRAMRGVKAVVALVLGLLLVVSAKHAGILPEGLLLKAEAREAMERQAGLDASSPLTFEAARWRAFLDSLER